MRILFLILVFLHFAAPSSASPWPRTEGEVFTSTSFVLPDDGPTATSFAMEYGLTDNTTLSGKVYLPGGNAHSGTASIAAQYTITKIADVHPVSIGLGVSAGIMQNAGSFMVESVEITPGISVGRGFEIAHFAGWATAGADFHVELPSGQNIAAMTSTIGLHVSERTMFFINLEGQIGAEHTDYSISSNYVYDLFESTSVQLHSTTGSGPSEVGISFWSIR